MFKTIKTATEIQAEATNNERKRRAEDLKRKLSETDYVALSDYDKEKPELIQDRANWRAELRELEPLIVPDDNDENEE